MNDDVDREDLGETDAPVPQEPERGSWVRYAIECNPLYVVGCLVAAVGIACWIGNWTGWFPTFSGSGLLFIILGAILWHLGILFPRRRRF